MACFSTSETYIRARISLRWKKICEILRFSSHRHVTVAVRHRTPIVHLFVQDQSAGRRYFLAIIPSPRRKLDADFTRHTLFNYTRPSRNDCHSLRPAKRAKTAERLHCDFEREWRAVNVCACATSVKKLISQLREWNMLLFSFFDVFIRDCDIITILN